MSKVEVLCPNGHRINIKTTPNTKLLQVLEEACAKKDFLPASDYCLKHGKKILDLTLTVRYAGLPNLAKLELVKSAKGRQEQNVVVALQLPSGERLQNEFEPSTSLWNILVYWESLPDSEDGGHPVCVYMREEIVGEYSLRNTSLRQLGLTGGRTIIRILHRAVEENILKAIKEKLDEELARQSQVKEIFKSAESETTETNAAKSASPVLESSSESTLESFESCNAAQVDSRQSTRQQQDSNNTLVQVVQNFGQNLQKMAQGLHSSMQTRNLSEPTATAMDTESEPRPESRSKSAEAVQGHKHTTQPMEVDRTGGTRKKNTQPMEVDRSGGARRRENVDAGASTSRQPTSSVNAHGGGARSPAAQMIGAAESDLTPDDQRIISHANNIAQSLVHRAMPGAIPNPADRAELDRLRAERRAQIEWESAQQRRLRELLNAQPTTEFKFPEETKGQDLYRNEWSEVKRDEYAPCDRETVLYNIERVPSLLQQVRESQEDLTEEFFEVTEQDVRTLWSDAQRKLREFEDQALMTKAMRLSQKESRMSKYERVAIRVQFPDKLVLQGLFRPMETVHALYKFVTQHLQQSKQEFYLFTSPPKCVLTDRSMTLIEADLAPMSVVYFGCDQTGADAATPKRLRPVGRTVLKKVRPSRKKVRPGRRTQSMRSGGTESSNEQSTEARAQSPRAQSARHAASTSTSSRTSSSQGKTPTWFKIGKK